MNDKCIIILIVSVRGVFWWCVKDSCVLIQVYTRKFDCCDMCMVCVLAEICTVLFMNEKCIMSVRAEIQIVRE